MLLSLFTAFAFLESQAVITFFSINVLQYNFFQIDIFVLTNLKNNYKKLHSKVQSYDAKNCESYETLTIWSQMS